LAKAWIGNNAATLLDGIFDEEDPVLEAVRGDYERPSSAAFIVGKAQ
jgi:hypothetical protein